LAYACSRRIAVTLSGSSATHVGPPPAWGLDTYASPAIPGPGSQKRRLRGGDLAHGAGAGRASRHPGLQRPARAADRARGVTLLGDAAHLTAPNGEGANLALYDGAELGKAIAAHPGDVESALTAYEREMFPRSAEAALEGADLREMLGEDTPYHLISLFTE
jgi:2-polyprenyl-6-methoxyphenol hydroxylase-like FAD-dependent oxidoreductase